MDNEFNAFEEGVSPGGLRNRNQIKLLIEYLADSLAEPLTADTAVESLTAHSLANYFEAVQAVDELVSNGSLLRDDNGTLMLTKIGSETLRELKSELPASVREVALNDAVEIQMRKRNEGITDVKIQPAGDGFNVICRIFHKEETLMELTLRAEDFDQAERIRTVFLKDPEKIYNQIISSF